MFFLQIWVNETCYPAELGVAMQISDFDGRNVKP